MGEKWQYRSPSPRRNLRQPEHIACLPESGRHKRAVGTAKEYQTLLRKTQMSDLPSPSKSGGVSLSELI
jgi:hypothetical protein